MKQIRFPGSRPVSRPQNYREQREKSWNERFTLGKISDYQLRPNYLRPVSRNSRMRITSVGQETAYLPKSMSTKSITPFVTRQTFKTAPVQRLLAAWNEFAIDQQFRKEFLYILKFQRKKDKLALQEIHELKRGVSLSQRIPEMVLKREQILKELLAPHCYISVDEAAEALTSLRTLTVCIVEDIRKWRDTLSAMCPQPDSYSKPVYLFNGENYLLKLKGDNKGLADSYLNEFFWFSKEVDPFLVAASKPGKTELPIDEEMMARIQSCQGVLFSEMVSKLTNIPEEQPLWKVLETELGTSLGFESSQHLIQELETYAPPPEIQNALGNPRTAYNNSVQLRFPAHLWIKRGKQRVGLLMINLELQKTAHKRLFISHLSCISVDLLPSILEFVLNYIWNTYPCVETRIGLLSHKTEQGKFETDPQMKEVFDKAGFRWKQRVNTPGDAVAITMLGLQRPADITCTHPETIDLFEDSLKLSYACIAQFDIVGESEPWSFAPLNPFSQIGVACALSGVKVKLEAIPELTAHIDALHTGWIPPAFRYTKDPSHEKALTDLKSLDLQVPPLERCLEFSVACSGLGLSWIKGATGTVAGLPFTKVSQTSISLVQSGDYSFYIVPTEDPNFTAFFIPWTDPVDDVFQVARMVLDQASEVLEELNEIWVPAFKVEAIKELDAVKNLPMEEYTVSHCFESVSISVTACQHPQGSLKLTPGEQEFVLKPPFLFGIMYSKPEQQGEVIILLCSQVPYPKQSF